VLAEGDLACMPDFAGLQLEALVHVAAATNFRTNSSGDPHQTNAAGTGILLRWAASRKIRHLHHVSSAYVCGRTSRTVPETFHHDRPAFHNDYEQSKWEAEHLCLDWSRQHDASLTVWRPSVIVGEHTTGRSTRFAGFYLSARSTEFLHRSFEHADAATRHSIPLRIRGRAEDCQNIVPVDYVAAMIAGALGRPESWGGVYHLTHPSAPTNQEIKSAFESYFQIGGGRFVHPDDFPADSLNEHEQRFYDISRSIEHYFVDTPRFERERTAALEGQLGICCPTFRADDIARLVAFAQSAGWGRESVSRRSTPGCRTYFERFLPRNVNDSQVADRTRVTATVRFVIEDDPGREWVCRFERGLLADVRNGPNGVQEDFGYRCNREVFWEAIAGHVHPQELFLSGRAEIFGDVERALKMAMILHEFNRERPCDANLLEQYEEKPCPAP
jgi:nucleoside-diphosphate-sugar epimerase